MEAKDSMFFEKHIWLLSTYYILSPLRGAKDNVEETQGSLPKAYCLSNEISMHQ